MMSKLYREWSEGGDDYGDYGDDAERVSMMMMLKGSR